MAEHTTVEDADKSTVYIGKLHFLQQILFNSLFGDQLEDEKSGNGQGEEEGFGAGQGEGWNVGQGEEEEEEEWEQN